MKNLLQITFVGNLDVFPHQTIIVSSSRSSTTSAKGWILSTPWHSGQSATCLFTGTSAPPAGTTISKILQLCCCKWQRSPVAGTGLPWQVAVGMVMERFQSQELKLSLDSESPHSPCSLPKRNPPSPLLTESVQGLLPQVQSQLIGKQANPLVC